MSDKEIELRAAELRRRAEVRILRKIENDKWQAMVQGALDEWRAALAVEKKYREDLGEQHHQAVIDPTAGKDAMLDYGYAELVRLMDETERVKRRYEQLVHVHNGRLAMENTRNEA